MIHININIYITRIKGYNTRLRTPDGKLGVRGLGENGKKGNIFPCNIKVTIQVYNTIENRITNK
jgi:hypothetical protein